MYLKSIEARTIADVAPGSFVSYSIHDHQHLAFVCEIEQKKMILELKELPGSIQDSNLYQATEFRGYPLIVFPEAMIKLNFDSSLMNSTKGTGNCIMLVGDKIILTGGNDFVNTNFDAGTGQVVLLSGEKAFYFMSWKLLAPGVNEEYETLLEV